MEEQEHHTFKNEILFDEQTWGILEKINPLHRHSLINASIKMISKTNYYKELAGLIDSSNSEEVVNLNVISNNKINITEPTNSTVNEQPIKSSKKNKKSLW